MVRVLVTGAAGFIGTHCIRRLLAEDCEVHATCRTRREEKDPRINWHVVDLRDPLQVDSLIRDVRPTHLLHGAWIATPGVYSESRENFDWLQASLVLARSFGLHGGRRFVGIGSSAEYFPGDSACIEDVTSVSATSAYGQCKVACWLGVKSAARCYGFSAAWGRLFLAYGDGESPKRLIPSLFASLLQMKSFATTYGTQTRDFIYAPDAAECLVQLLLSSEEGVFNVGTGRRTSVRYVVEYLANQLGGKDLLRFGAITVSAWEPEVLVADTTKCQAQLRWSVKTKLEDCLDLLIANARELFKNRSSV